MIYKLIRIVCINRSRVRMLAYFYSRIPSTNHLRIIHIGLFSAFSYDTASTGAVDWLTGDNWQVRGLTHLRLRLCQRWCWAYEPYDRGLRRWQTQRTDLSQSSIWPLSAYHCPQPNNVYCSKFYTSLTHEKLLLCFQYFHIKFIDWLDSFIHSFIDSFIHIHSY